MVWTDRGGGWGVERGRGDGAICHLTMQMASLTHCSPYTSLPLFSEPSAREVGAKHPSLQLPPNLPARPSGEAAFPVMVGQQPSAPGEGDEVGRN